MTSPTNASPFRPPINRNHEKFLSLASPWTRQLYRKRGAELLEYLTVYYDFNWLKTVGHRRATLKNGKSLATAVKNDCPTNLLPAILLTTRDDHEEGPIETKTHYVVVVHVHNFLSQGTPDATATYFARLAKTRVTSLNQLREIWEKPEVRKFALDSLTGTDIQEWISTNSEALKSLADTVRTKALTIF